MRPIIDSPPHDGVAWRRLVDCLPAAAVLVEGPRLWLNEAAQSLTGYGADEIATLSDWFARLFPERAEQMRHVYEATRRAGFAHSDIHLLVRKGGETRSVEITAHHQDGRTEVWLLRDVTELQRRTQTQKLESLSALAGGIAHDFNNLLTTIMGYTSLARLELPENSTLHEYLRHVEDAARRAAELTRQMLAYSGRAPLSFAPVDLGRLVNDLGPILRTTIAGSAELQMEVEEDMPHLEGDVRQLRDVIVSLIANAAEAMDNGKGRINVRVGSKHLADPERCSSLAHSDLPSGRFVRLQVEDNGAGMSREVLARMFDPFFSTKFAGRGLGLAAVLGIIKGHRGFIRVKSEARQGTSVELLFPEAPHP